MREMTKILIGIALVGVFVKVFKKKKIIVKGPSHAFWK